MVYYEIASLPDILAPCPVFPEKYSVWRSSAGRDLVLQVTFSVCNSICQKNVGT